MAAAIHNARNDITSTQTGLAHPKSITPAARGQGTGKGKPGAVSKVPLNERAGPLRAVARGAGLSVGGIAVYKPARMWMGDLWCIAHEGVMHMFVLDYSVPPVRELPEESIGHATSEDLITWREQPTALERGAPGQWDDLALWTGSCLRHEGRFLMAYTGISSGDRIQRVGMATSDDLTHWIKCPGNPAIEPDPGWYEVPEPGSDLNGGWAAWRDPWLMWDEGSGCFYAAITARINEGDPHERGCIALARSRDAVAWEVLPPLAAPGLYHDLEVPQIFEADGRWFLLHSTSVWRYSEMARLQIPEEYVQNGPHYLISNDPLSGWRVPPLDVFAGAQADAPYATRVVQWKGRRVMLHWGPGRRALALPKELLVDGDRLACGYYDALDAYRAGALFAPVAEARLADDERMLGAADSFILEADLTVEAGRAGFICGRRDDDAGYAALVNLADQRVEAVCLADGDAVAYHPCSVVPGAVLPLKLVSDGDVLDIYVADRFALAFRIPRVHEGEIGVIAQGGAATFRNVRAEATTLPVMG